MKTVFAIAAMLLAAPSFADEPTVTVAGDDGVRWVPLAEYVDSLVAKAKPPAPPPVVWTWQTGSDYGGAALYRDKGLHGWLLNGRYFAWVAGKPGVPGAWVEGPVPADAPPPPKVAPVARVPNVGSCPCHAGGKPCLCVPASKCAAGQCPVKPTSQAAPVFTLPAARVCST